MLPLRSKQDPLLFECKLLQVVLEVEITEHSIRSSLYEWYDSRVTQFIKTAVQRKTPFLLQNYSCFGNSVSILAHHLSRKKYVLAK